MEYTPEEIQRMAVREKSSSDGATDGLGIIRGLRVTGFERQDGLLSLRIETLPLPLTIPETSMMTFGDESITAIEYFRRVIENGDMIDAVLLPQVAGAFPLKSFWIRIKYVGEPALGQQFSKKDDGLFAMRAKAGEKAERIVARTLRNKFGHSFPPGMCDSAGYFEIRYIGKKQRKPDRKCLTCGLTFEIKKRNKDHYFRVSHSDGRTFASENALDGWHAFVFPDMKPRFIVNATIAKAIEDKRFKPGKDKYDSWADINADAVVITDPPDCISPV